MATAPHPARHAHKFISRSSVYEKVPHDLRLQIESALIRHDPPTYKAVYERFALPNLGVSRSSFYTYARHIRYHAALIQRARAALPSEEQVTAMAERLLGQHLILVLMDDLPRTKTVHALATAWRGVMRARLVKERASLERDGLLPRRRSPKRDLTALLAACRGADAAGPHDPDGAAEADHQSERPAEARGISCEPAEAGTNDPLMCESPAAPPPAAG